MRLSEACIEQVGVSAYTSLRTLLKQPLYNTLYRPRSWRHCSLRQTALRESIGRRQLAQMITERETLGQELQKILDEKTTSWGITVQSVEIRDVRIPQALENAMSQQTQAERERQARVILGEAEVQVSAQFAQASRVYNDNPGALHLRGMNMLYEAMRERGRWSSFRPPQ
jgi:membrane protease subunit (stomatin/prohibitin family)